MSFQNYKISWHELKIFKSGLWKRGEKIGR